MALHSNPTQGMNYLAHRDLVALVSSHSMSQYIWWKGAVCLHTKFPLPILLYAGYTVKLKNRLLIIVNKLGSAIKPIKIDLK